MRPSALPIALTAALILTGCSAGTNSSARDDEPQAPPAHCLTLSEGALESLQRHLQGGTLILDIAAALSPTTGEAWFVAADVDSDGTKVRAIWYTMNDPTAEGENAYLSVNAMAATLSDYNRPTDATGTEDGAQLAEDCLP